MEIQEKIKQSIKDSLSHIGIEIELDEIELTPTKHASYGDLASNIAMKIAKRYAKVPRELAAEIIANVSLDEIERFEIAGPGFINIFLKKDNIFAIVNEVLTHEETFPELNVGKKVKTLLEYVSANPTGALHLGHARGAAVGDSLSRIMKQAGYDVTREYYVNDAGNQVNNLAKSLKARYYQALGKDMEMPENGYYGKDIIAFANELVKEVGSSHLEDEDDEFFRLKGIEMALEGIKRDLREFRVEFDVFSSEKSIRDQGKVEEVVKELKPYCYEKDGAVYLNTTKDGDDKDRVIVKSDGSYTYLLPDIAYHKDKFDRGYELLIDFFGADHHGYITRLKSSMKSLGYNPDNLKVDLVQMVRLFKDGQEFKMSKRTGNAVSLKELCEEVGVDAVRFFFVSRANSQHLDFNLDLAKEMSNSNPVYYAQYAHARLSTVLKMAEGRYEVSTSTALLKEKAEVELAKKIAEIKGAIRESALTLNPCKITIYVRELAAQINEFYTACHILDASNHELTCQRLALVKAAKITLQKALNLIGVSAPDHM
ncbi:MAG: arginine--tRNA ligase [Firmicutes bacterium]|uniref:Arginine--tRNA ligase n=1 Tax=Candidatus Scatoplasma merdavium TaxID=2840932 RepID=A0A9D9D8W0_9BACL|nr:arginine--tRNA ligase [Candidatus Scatoplasma merdavium]